MTGAHSQAQDLPDVLVGFFVQRVCNPARRTFCLQIQVTHLFSSGDDQ